MTKNVSVYKGRTKSVPEKIENANNNSNHITNFYFFFSFILLKSI